MLSCTGEEQPDTALIKGTWEGTLDSTAIIEYKVYAPAIEDSLTRLTDSVYTIHGVMLNFGIDEVKFYGMRSVLASPYLYLWDGSDTILFQKKAPANELLKDESGEILMDAILRRSFGEIVKLNSDSLVMKLYVYNKDWKEYLLKLKRRTSRN